MTEKTIISKNNHSLIKCVQSRSGHTLNSSFFVIWRVVTAAVIVTLDISVTLSAASSSLTDGIALLLGVPIMIVVQWFCALRNVQLFGTRLRCLAYKRRNASKRP